MNEAWRNILIAIDNNANNNKENTTYEFVWI